MKKKSKKKTTFQKIEDTAANATTWLGSTKSLFVHTIIFLACFIIPLFGVPIDHVLLVLTTALSLEAIYLAIFIQMSVNKNTQDIEEIQEDIEEISEDIEDIGEDVEEIQKDVDEIQEDVDEIQEDIEGIEEDSEEDLKHEQKEVILFSEIQQTLTRLQNEIEQLKMK